MMHACVFGTPRRCMAAHQQRDLDRRSQGSPWISPRRVFQRMGGDTRGVPKTLAGMSVACCVVGMCLSPCAMVVWLCSFSYVLMCLYVL